MITNDLIQTNFFLRIQNEYCVCIYHIQCISIIHKKQHICLRNGFEWSLNSQVLWHTYKWVWQSRSPYQVNILHQQILKLNDWLTHKSNSPSAPNDKIQLKTLPLLLNLSKIQRKEKKNYEKTARNNVAFVLSIKKYERIWKID